MDPGWNYEVSHERDASYQTGGSDMATLQQFLSRPLRIYGGTWTPGAAFNASFNPWELYFSNSNVLDKINLFRNLRCDLHIKVMINGNGFYYGRILVSYNPYTVNDDVTRLRTPLLTQDLVQASQKPHILLDPSTSQGGEMVLPFIWPENWLDITQASWWSGMGDLYLSDFNILRHANGGTDAISINVLAWAENVELCIPTTALAQSGKMPAKKAKKKKPQVSISNKSELNDSGGGLISQPASAIAAAANMLAAIPVIRPYALATSMIADKVGSVARIFGYSRPQNLQPVSPFVPRFLTSLANTDTSENVQKLSVDSKNELTIDSRVMGLDGSDELTIQSIASRDSFLVGMDWFETNVYGDILGSFRVDPMALQVLSASPVREIHPTALCFASAPFRYWRGSMIFRFQIVASQFHKGRLKIAYDPNKWNSNDYNQAFSTVIDISETRDFEYVVHWTQTKAWCDVRTYGDAQFSYTYNTSGIAVTPDQNTCNGSLTISVVNELSTASSSIGDQVYILAWVRAGPDYELAVPRDVDSIAYLSPFQQQSGAMSDDIPPSRPHSVDVYQSNEAQGDENLVYQGERIVSFRQLLKRYWYHRTYLSEAAASTAYLTYVSQIFPFYRGWSTTGVDQGIDSTAATSPYNFTGYTLMNYLTPAFAMRRGGIRYKYVAAVRTVNNVAQPTMQVSRLPSPTTYSHTEVAVATTLTESELLKRTVAIKHTGDGAALTPVRINPVLEIEFPFYTRGQRFVPARDLSYTTGRSHDAFVLTTYGGTATGLAGVDTYVAAAEDFNLGFYVGAPVLFSYADPNTPP